MTTTALTVPKEANEVAEEGLILITQADELVVTDAESFEQGGQFLLVLKKYQKRVREIMDPIVKAADAAHKVAVRQRGVLLDPAVQAETIVKGRLTAWEQAEQARLKAAAQQSEETARRLAEQAKQAEVARLEAEGQEARAAAVRAAPPPVVLTPPVPTMPKVAGVSFRDHWTAKVVDFRKLVEAVAKGEQPLDLLQADQSALDALARTFKQHLNVPGVEAKHERIAGGSGR